VFGDERDWTRAREDLQSALSLYEASGQYDRALESHANLVSHRLDRDIVAPDELASLLEEMQRLEHRVPPEILERSFFFVYQKARLFEKATWLEEARRTFAAAAEVARLTESPHRAALARWRVLRLRKQDNDISEHDYLHGLDGIATVLRRFTGDAWSTNALAILLIDVARLRLNRGEKMEGWTAAEEALVFRLRRLQGDSATSEMSRSRLREPLEIMRKANPDIAPGSRLSTELGRFFKQLVGQPPYAALDWGYIDRWLAGSGA